MRINNASVFYTGDNNADNTKKYMITNHMDIQKAISEGELMVDGVTLELSEEVRNAIRVADEKRFKDCERINEYNAAIQNANAAKQQGEVMKAIVDEQAKALEIARRIAKGGHVPLKDEQLLMDYSSELYQMAKQQAMLAKEHEKYKTLVEEKEQSETADSNEGTINAKVNVQVEVSMGDVPNVESVAEVVIEA